MIICTIYKALFQGKESYMKDYFSRYKGTKTLSGGRIYSYYFFQYLHGTLDIFRADGFEKAFLVGDFEPLRGIDIAGKKLTALN
jgi:hypothetical protein